MHLRIEFERETDGRWIAEAIRLAGVMSYGATREEAEYRVTQLAEHVAAGRTMHIGTEGLAV